ncbi:MAG: aminopeptidase P family protein [Cyclobacteriaceae bacterium]|nr:aminopeptidase P family protein [Cyclobacteriaceae bacterium]
MSILNKIQLAVVFCFGMITPFISTAQQTEEQKYFEWANLPFPKEEYAQRRDKMITELNSSEGSIFLCPSRDGLSDGETFRQLDDFNYFTGLEFPNSILVIDAYNKKNILFAPLNDFRFEAPSRRNDFPGRPLGDDVELKNKSGISDIRPFEELDEFIKKNVNANKSFKVNYGGHMSGELVEVNTSYISSLSTEQLLVYHLQQTFPTIQIESAYKAVGNLRMIKSPLEIAALREAADITVQGIKVAVKHIAPGIDERTLEAEMEAEFKRLGSPRIPFASIIKSGPNSLWPWRILAAHYERRNRKMKAGELVIFDVGCEYKNYVSDMGRTFPVSGKFTEEQRKILIMETSVSDAIIAAIKPGVTFADLKKVADTAIPESEKKYMQVGLFFGHHLGLSSGDPNDPQAKLAPGMVFTVEPWYYNHDKNISVFTEDEVLVTSNGVEVLTKALPRTPEELERLMKK